MSTQDLRGRKSTLLQRYQRNAESQDPLNQPMNTSAPISKSTSQRSLQNSTLLQRRYSKTTSQDLQGESNPSNVQAQPSKTGSQRSLDQSKLLQRYYKQNSQDSQDGTQPPAPQHYSSQKNLENSKLLQRYGPQAQNHSQEFTGLAPRESTPVARFQRSGSLDQDRTVRSSLLSKYTPRFGQSLDRNKAVGAGGYSNYSSQHSLDQNMTQSQTFADYGSDHFDQYDSRNLRSRSTSLARGLNSRSMQRELGPPPTTMNIEMEKENVPTEPITAETLPVVATTEPVMGLISSALPMPSFGVIPPTPMVETSKPTLSVDTNKLQPVAPPPVTVVQQPVTPPTVEVEKPKRKEPVKPPRKDLAASATVSIPIPTITTTIAKIDPPKALIPTTKLAAPVVPKDPSPPLFSNRDRMDHYGSASNPSQSSPKAQSPKPQPASATTQLPMNRNLLMPISDLSSRRSMTDLRQAKQEETNAFAMDIDEASDRNDLRVIAKKKDPVKNTLASAFEQIAVLSVPQVTDAFEEREKIEALPPDRKLKKRDHTYHPSFVPKQVKLEEEEKKKQEEKAKQEVQKQEQERRKEEERVKKENERLRKESEKMRKEEEKRMKEEEKRLKAEDDKRRKDEEKMAKEQEKRLKEDEKRKKEEEKRKQKEEKKKASAQKPTAADQEPAAPAEEESIDLGSHLDQYSISVPAQTRSTSAPGRPRSSGTPRGSQAALNRQTLPGVSNPMYSSQQSLDRSSGLQSKMLQRYAKRSGSQDFTHHDEMQRFVKDVHRSQGSLEQRVSRSTLLQKYTPKPLSASTAATGQAAVAPSSTPRSTSQVSLDKNRIEKSSLLQRYKPKEGSVDQSETDQRMGAVVFQPKKISGKHATFDYRDHEYEPIGEPVDSKPAASSLAPPTDAQQRKLSSASLRVPGDADADTISMNELQKDIEDRYFNRQAEEDVLDEAAAAEPNAGDASAQDKTSKMKAVMARAQESGKKAMARAQESSKNAMSKAQEGGKSLQQKLRKQTDRFKTKMTNINIKKDKEVAPLASPEIVTTPEIEKLDFTIAEPKSEQEAADEIQPEVTVTVEDANEAEQEEAAAETGASKKKFKTPEFSKLKNIHMPKLQKPEFKRPEFTKITKPKMPKLKTPDMSKFKRPEMPKFLTEKPDFSKLKMPEKIGTIKLQRSKSMKEPSDVASAASPSDASVVGDDDTKKKINYTDFSTYPRLLDKFKRQKSAPGNASVRASTPPPLEFTKAGKTTRPKGKTFISRWAEKSSEGAGSSLFFTGSELGERESSVEKRMRQRLERADFDTPELPITAEQKQLEEYDKENREIHLVSAARHDEFMKRKPPMERQESDLASEEEKQFWASSLGQKIRQNIDMNSNDFDFLDEDERLRVARENEAMGLSERDRARFLGEPVEHSEKDYDLRSTTPYSNKECQSSTGSSGIRRRKGVLEEIDDDEFFLRQKGISKDNIQMGEYISSAIKEGLGTPVNALAEMGRYDSYDQDMDVSERMSMEYRAEMSFADEFRRNADMFKTFPPDRPTRKQKKSYNEEQFEDDAQKVPYDSYPQAEEELEFYGRDRKYASEEPRQLGDERYIDEESIGNGFSRTGAAVPPTPPRRRKKRFRDVTPSELEPFANGLTSKPIYNSYTLGPETHLFNAEVPLAREESFTTPLPTPRRSRSRSQISKTFDDDRTSRGAESYIFGAVDSAMVKRSMDMSESNGYATVRKDPPPRPPAPIRRRRSTRSLGDQRQFSTLPNFHSISPVRPSRNYSTINPNRPPRMKSNTNLDQESMRSASVSKNDFTEYEDIEQMEEQARMHQALATGAVANKMKDRPLPPPPRPPRDHKKPKKPDHDDRYDFDGGAEKIVSMPPQPFERVEEVEIAIQTDPLPEDYELDIEVSETLGAAADEEAPTKTLQEILKEEQQAEIDRARQLAEANSLMREIQKFRDSTSSLSQQGSRPETPAASILERRVSVPTASSMRSEVRPLSNENLSEQDLAHAEDDKYIAELVKKYVSEEKVTPTESTKRQPKAAPAPQPAAREVDAEKLREIESMIVSEQVDREDIRLVQAEPAAPPRRRSLVASSQDLSRSVEISPNVIEEIVERLRTNEQLHIAELQQLQQQQLEELKKQQEEQQRLHDQKLEEQQKQLMEQQNQQLQETQQLKEQILQQQEQQRELLLQLQQQEKEREHARELAQQRAKELEQQRMLELQQQQLILQQQEKEREHARELEQQLAKELEQQRIRETQRIHELEMQRAREAELLRAKEAELLRAKEAELLRAKEAEMLRAMEAEMLRAREAELLRAREAELQKAKSVEPKETGEATASSEAKAQPVAEPAVVTVSEPQEPSNEISEEPATKEAPPARPPPPRISPQPPIAPAQFPYQEYMPYSLPPQPFYPVRNYSDDEAALPQAPQRRRRHHRSRRESTSEEEFQRDQRKQRHGTRSPEPSIPALGGQLIRACGNSIRDTGDELMTILRASSKDENKRDLHIALIILIVIVAGLMALGMSAERDVHHHHWDYFNPPGNGRA